MPICSVAVGVAVGEVDDERIERQVEGKRPWNRPASGRRAPTSRRRRRSRQRRRARRAASGTPPLPAPQREHQRQRRGGDDDELLLRAPGRRRVDGGGIGDHCRHRSSFWSLTPVRGRACAGLRSSLASKEIMESGRAREAAISEAFRAQTDAGPARPASGVEVDAAGGDAARSTRPGAVLVGAASAAPVGVDAARCARAIVRPVAGRAAGVLRDAAAGEREAGVAQARSPARAGRARSPGASPRRRRRSRPAPRCRRARCGSRPARSRPG